MSQLKKILFVYDRMMIGGTTTALLSLLNELDYERYSVDLLLFETSGLFLKEIPKEVHILEPALKKSVFPFLDVSKRKIIGTLLNGGALRAVMARIKYKGTSKGNLRNILMHYGICAQVYISRKLDESYDVAIGFMEGWSDHYVMSKKIKARKKIVWCHPDYKNSYLIPECDRMIFQKASNIVVVSEKCLENIRDIFPEFKEKTSVIKNINSSELIQKRAQQSTPEFAKAKVNLCTVARCDRAVKGLDRILNVLCRLKAEHLLEDVKWHYIGVGKDYPWLKQQIAEKNLQENVVCYGELRNPLVYLKQMDGFILASRYEGQPVSVEEALALCVPCIVTEYASAKEQIVHGINGLIGKNSEDGLYVQIKKFLLSENLQKELQAGACQHQIEYQKEIEKLDILIQEKNYE